MENNQCQEQTPQVSPNAVLDAAPEAAEAAAAENPSSEKIKTPFKKKPVWILIPIILVVLIVAGIFIGKSLQSNKKEEDKLFDNGMIAVKVGEQWGLINRSENFVVDPAYDNIALQASDGLYRIDSDGRYGFLDTKGNIKVTPQFDFAYDFSDSLAAVKVGSNWGFINKNGTIVINPQFATAFSFHDCYALVVANKKYGIIDKKGNYVVVPQYDYILPYLMDGLFLVEMNDKYGCVNTKGKCVITPQFDEMFFFLDTGENKNIAVVSKDGKEGYIDKTGKYIIAPQFDSASYFSEGLALVSISGKYGYINKKGSYVINPQFDDAGHFIDGLALVSFDDKYGYINKKGNYVIQPLYDEAEAFDKDSGTALVELDGKYGYIDKKGNYVIEPKYDNALSFSHGSAIVKENGNWGVIDKTGNYRINPSFAEMDYADKDIFWFKKDDKTEGFIKSDGTILIEDLTDSSQAFYADGYAVVATKNGKWGVIDRSGGYVLQPIYDGVHEYDEKPQALCNYDSCLNMAKSDSRYCSEHTKSSSDWHFCKVKYCLNKVYSDYRDYCYDHSYLE